MKVALLIYADQVGGHEIMSALIAERLSVAPELDLFLYFPDKLNNLSALKLDDLKCHKISYRKDFFTGDRRILNFIHNFFMMFFLAARMSRSFDACLHCQGSIEVNWPFNLWSKVFGLRVVSYVPYTIRPSQMHARFATVRDHIFPLLCRLPEKFAVIHELYQKDLRMNLKIRKDKIVVIPNIVSGRQKLERRKANKGTLFRFAVIGRVLFKQKGQNTALEAFALALKENIHAELIFVGSGPDEQVLQAQIEQLDLQQFCKLVTWQNDIRKVLGEVDCIILPSTYEGVSLLMLEALSDHVPIIASDYVIHKWYICSRFIFRRGDKISLAARIIEAYDFIEGGEWRTDDNYKRVIPPAPLENIDALTELFIN